MAQRFNLSSLPNDIREKIQDIQWNIGDFQDEKTLGLVNLTDEWVFTDDYSHIKNFKSKTDLIKLIRKETKKVWKEKTK